MQQQQQQQPLMVALPTDNGRLQLPVALESASCSGHEQQLSPTTVVAGRWHDHMTKGSNPSTTSIFTPLQQAAATAIVCAVCPQGTSCALNMHTVSLSVVDYSSSSSSSSYVRPFLATLTAADSCGFITDRVCAQRRHHTSVIDQHTSWPAGGAQWQQPGKWTVLLADSCQLIIAADVVPPP
jgi:hypothetical protein